MGGKKYKLRILPLFEEDLNGIVDYIAFQLQNPIAAERLADAVEEAIEARLPFAESFEPYRSARERKYPYYRISVKNYTIFYVVIDDITSANKDRKDEGDGRNWRQQKGDAVISA